jgi:hypothetical protein
MINELWEGPRNVLLTQIYRDMQRAASWYPVKQCINDLLYNADSCVIDDVTAAFDRCLSSNFIYPGQDNDELCLLWEEAVHKLLHEFQNCALHEVEAAREDAALAGK